MGIGKSESTPYPPPHIKALLGVFGVYTGSFPCAWTLDGGDGSSGGDSAGWRGESRGWGGSSVYFPPKPARGVRGRVAEVAVCRGGIGAGGGR